MTRNATLALLSSMILVAPLSIAAQPADAVYHNGTILTMNDAAPQSQAVAVKDGRIVGKALIRSRARPAQSGQRQERFDNRRLASQAVELGVGHVQAVQSAGYESVQVR